MENTESDIKIWKTRSLKYGKFRLNMDSFHVTCIKRTHIAQLILLIVSLYLFCQFKLIYRV